MSQWEAAEKTEGFVLFSIPGGFVLNRKTAQSPEPGADYMFRHTDNLKESILALLRATLGTAIIMCLKTAGLKC